MTPVLTMNANKLKVQIYETRQELGEDAANDAAKKIKELLSSKHRIINIIFAAAPSQNEFLCGLSKQPGIDWSRVNAFHMDEYVGLEKNSTQTFAFFLKENIFDKVPFKSVHYINGNAVDTEIECQRYAALLEEFPVDIVCMGIGENTHIAFNDPHIANFADPDMVKVVTLDEVSRQQQVNDQCFDTLEEVPFLAITLTVPALIKADTIFCMVPGKNKAAAAYKTLNSEVDEMYPSTVLQRHSNATLYLDKDSAARL